jgi:heptosyltransferase I
MKTDIKKKRHHERGNPLFKFVDRYIGIPIVALTGLVKNKNRKIPARINRIALLKTAGIGDTVILSGAIRSVRTAYPEAEIVLFCGKNNTGIAKMIKEVDCVVELPIVNVVATIRAVRKKGRFDVWLDFGPWPRMNAIITIFSKSSFTVGFETKNQYRHYCYDAKVAHVDHVDNFHELNNYGAIIAKIGVAAVSLPHIDIPEVTGRKMQIAIQLFPGGSQSFLKEWPRENWIYIIQYLIEHGISVVFTGGKEDRERIEVFCSELINASGIRNAAGTLSLYETALVLKESSCVISVDTGIMHLASALDCPLIVLHGPTAPGRWGPLNKNAKVLSGKPCLKGRCIDWGFENICDSPGKCMKSIHPDVVIDAIKNMLFSNHSI